MPFPPAPSPRVETLVIHERRHRVSLTQAQIDDIVIAHLAQLAGVEGDSHVGEALAEGQVPGSLSQAPMTKRVYLITENLIAPATMSVSGPPGYA